MRRAITKRQRFIFTSFILSFGFLSMQFLDERFRFVGIGILSLLTVILFFWSLREGLGRNLTLLALVLPLFYTLGVGLFWFLLPANIFTRIPIVILYGLGIYALCLTSNIYTVSTIRTIALLRAARGVGFVFTLLTLFLIYDTILSLRVNILLTSILVFVVSLPMFMHSFWTILLEKKFSIELLSTSFVVTFVIGQIAAGLYFWPVSVVVGSLFITIACYVALGLGQAKLEGRLFSQTVREYLILGALVFIGMFLVTSWRG